MNGWEWPNGHNHAVSVVFEGTTEEQSGFALAFLAAKGIRATFYADPEPFLQSLSAWQKAITLGNEVGNGCLIRAALPSGELPLWTRGMIEEDIAQTETLLDETLGAALARSFCFPIGLPRCSEGDYSDVIRNQFRYARGGDEGFNDPQTVDLQSILWCDPRDVTDHIAVSERSIWAVARVESHHHSLLEQAVDEWLRLATIIPVVDAARFIRKIRESTGAP